MFYNICYTCRLLICARKKCEAPHCHPACIDSVDHTNVEYDFCPNCETSMTAEFRNQLDGKPVRIRIEEK